MVYLGGSACYGNGKNTREIPEQSPWRQEPELTYLRRRWRGGMLGAMATAGEMRYGLRRPIPRRSVGGSMTPAAGARGQTLPTSGWGISARPVEYSLASRARNVASGRPARRSAATLSRACGEMWIGCGSSVTGSIKTYSQPGGDTDVCME